LIITRLQGGLGNQLFQYAAARALATRLDKPFKLEIITTLQKDKKRDIALYDLQANFELAEKKELKEFIFFPSLYRHKPAFFSRFGKNVYREQHFHFDKKIFQLTDPVYLDGFWQSPLYFRGIESILKQDFTVKDELVKNVTARGKELAGKDSIAIHIRRGDLLNPKAMAYHGVLDKTYYEKAIRLLAQKVSSASFHVFSDDIGWAKQNLVLPAGTEFVSSITKSAIEDFYLMTKCRHNIIANSSFSWWPAWLNDNPRKIIVAPKNWFADNRINTDDLIPPEWIRI
jgi:Glycosyl transferase family 11